MSKVYFITKSPFPYGYASTNRLKCYAKALKSQGTDCEMIIFQRGCIRDNRAKGVYEGIPYLYVGGKSLRSSSKYIARINDIIDRIKVVTFMLHVKPKDTVYFYQSIPFIIVLLFIAKIKGARCLSELCEYPYIGSTKSSWGKKIGKWFVMNILMKRYDGFVAISDSLVKLAKQISPQSEIIKVPILVDYSRFYETNNACNDKSDPYIFHSGSLTEQKDGIVGMIKAYGEVLKRTNIPLKFYSTGNIASSKHADEIKELIEQYNLHGKLVFLGYLSEKDLLHYLRYSKLVILNKYPTLQNKYCFATKLGEYMAMGKVVIITKVGESMNWLHNRSDCFMINPYDTEDLVKAVIEVLNNNDL